jgi:hypothetical protein
MNNPTAENQTTTPRPHPRLARPTATIIVIVIAAIGLAACGSSNTPHIASLPASSNGASGGTPVNAPSTPTTTHRHQPGPAKGSPTALLVQWANCMQTHGDPNQAAPTIDAYGVITVSVPSGAPSLSAEVHAGADPCNRYMAAAQSALRAANPVAPPPGQTELVKYVNCMRANGVPNYPYPTGNSTNFNGTGVDPTSPAVMAVNRVCGRKLNLPGWWIAGNGPPGDVEVRGGGPIGGVPAGNGGPAVIPRASAGG